MVSDSCRFTSGEHICLVDRCQDTTTSSEALEVQPTKEAKLGFVKLLKRQTKINAKQTKLSIYKKDNLNREVRVEESQR